MGSHRSGQCVPKGSRVLPNYLLLHFPQFPNNWGPHCLDDSWIDVCKSLSFHPISLRVTVSYGLCPEDWRIITIYYSHYCSIIWVDWCFCSGLYKNFLHADRQCSAVLDIFLWSSCRLLPRFNWFRSSLWRIFDKLGKERIHLRLFHPNLETRRWINRYHA